MSSKKEETTPTAATEEVKKKRRRRGSSPLSDWYFTQVHEDAIVAYNNSSDPRFRNDIYVRIIGPVLNELVDKIACTFRFTKSLPNIDSVKEECKIWLSTVLEKFKPEKQKKAFAYFSVITRNWFICEGKKNSRRLKTEETYDNVVLWDDSARRETRNDSEALYDTIKSDEKWESEEFSRWFKEDFRHWDKEDLNEDEVAVLCALKELLKKAKKLELVNKKAIMVYMKEITGLTSKRITAALSKFKTLFDDFEKDWSNDKF